MQPQISQVSLKPNYRVTTSGPDWENQRNAVVPSYPQGICSRPPWVPETRDSTEPFVYFFFLYLISFHSREALYGFSWHIQIASILFVLWGPWVSRVRVTSPVVPWQGNWVGCWVIHGPGAFTLHKGMIHVLGRKEWEGVTFHHTTQSGAPFKTYALFISGVFRLIFSYRS